MANEILKQTELLQGKVAAILTERELAINVGSVHGVKVGTRFKVLSQEATRLEDPETGDMLGFVEREKVRVQVIEVHEKYSICKTYETILIPGGAYAIGGVWFKDMFAEPKELPVTLKAKYDDYLPPLREEESYVKRGDKVVQLSKGEIE